MDKSEYVKRESAKGDGGHTCHADGCAAKVPPAMFMCKRHWFMVPRGLRTTIWCLYEPGQEVDKNPTRAYVRAALDAIAAVASKEAERE